MWILWFVLVAVVAIAGAVVLTMLVRKRMWENSEESYQCVIFSEEFMGVKFTWYRDRVEMENKSGATLTELKLEFMSDKSLKIGPFTKSESASLKQSWKDLKVEETVQSMPWNMRRLTSAKVTVNGETREVSLPLGKKK